MKITFIYKIIFFHSVKETFEKLFSSLIIHKNTFIEFLACHSSMFNILFLHNFFRTIFRSLKYRNLLSQNGFHQIFRAVARRNERSERFVQYGRTTNRDTT